MLEVVLLLCELLLFVFLIRAGFVSQELFVTVIDNLRLVVQASIEVENLLLLYLRLWDRIFLSDKCVNHYA